MQEQLLQHLAIIMDGNRRWASERGLPKLMGHTEGAKTLRKIAKAVSKHGIPYLTVFALSTENLKRSEKELKHLFSLFEKLVEYLDDFLEHEARLNIIGDLSRLPEKTKNKLLSMMEKTKEHKRMTLTLAIAYGGRDEIVRAVQKAVTVPPKSGKITEENFEQLLDSAGLPNVDLLIRTSGHQRISNFLLWKAAYAELYFTDTYWPAFTEQELQKAIDWFYEQRRNFGK